MCAGSESIKIGRVINLGPKTVPWVSEWVSMSGLEFVVHVKKSYVHKLLRVHENC